MALVVTVVCWVALQQLALQPETPSIGESVLVRTELADGPATGVEVRVVLPDGSQQTIGLTDVEGQLRFVPEVPGQHTLVADVAGVRCLVPLFAQPDERKWLLALVSVPLGLALLWIHLRRIHLLRNHPGGA